MKTYYYLSKYQKHHNFKKREDYYFFLEHKYLLSNLEMYRFLLNPKDEFELIRANIVIHSLLNKIKLDKAIQYAFGSSKMNTSEAIEYVKSQMEGLPYICDGQNKIYIPIFTRALNMLYYKDFGRLLLSPYNSLIKNFDSSCIDLFETYNFLLYDSLFTKFVKVYQDEEIMVVYHFDFQSLYVINNEGRLDAKIALFDKYMHKPITNHIVERVEDVIKAYKNDDRDAFYSALINNQLVSSRLINKIRRKEARFLARKHKKIR